jgi:hypothetical protein
MFWMVVVEPTSLVEVGGTDVLAIALVTVGWDVAEDPST